MVFRLFRPMGVDSQCITLARGQLKKNVQKCNHTYKHTYSFAHESRLQAPTRKRLGEHTIGITASNVYKLDGTYVQKLSHQLYHPCIQPSSLGSVCIRQLSHYSRHTHAQPVLLSDLPSGGGARNQVQLACESPKAKLSRTNQHARIQARVYSGTRSLHQPKWWKRLLGKTKSGTENPGTIPMAAPRRSECTRAPVLGRVRHDDFAWLQNAEDRDTVEYLRAENAYSEWYMRDTQWLQHQLFEETLRVHPHESESLPERVDDYMYYTRTPDTDGALPIYCRRQRLSSDDSSLEMTGMVCLVYMPFAGVTGYWVSEEQVLIDQNVLVQQCGFLMIDSVKLSHDHSKLAFSMDSTGDESLSAVVLNLADGECRVIETIPSVVSIEWSADGEHVLYTAPDHHGRPYEIRCHKLGTNCIADLVVLTERDESVFLDVSLTKDKRFITLNANSKMTSEVHVLDAKTPHGKPILVREREKGVEYFVEHRNDKFYIVTNIDKAEAYKIITTPDAAPQSENWTDLFQGETNEPIVDMDIYADYCVMYMRDKYGAPKMTIMDLNTRELRTAKLPSSACTLIPGANQTYNTHCLRLGLSSPSTPEVVVTCDLRDGSVITHREVSIPSLSEGIADMENIENRMPPTLVKDDIEVRQIFAESADGTAVPMTLIAKRGVLEQSSPSPLIVQGYGAYGHKLDADYKAERIPMLNRGFVYALCHVRGGGEHGKRWHRMGKLMNKHRSFEDMEACVRHLHSAGVSQASLTAIRGSSAGGLLAAAVVIRSPFLFKCAVMKVPFTDVLTAMLDDTLALTVHEYDEWGDPSTSVAVYDYIKTYCPYDNLTTDSQLPDMLFTGSMKDNRVPYWHPAKMVAKLRHLRSLQYYGSRLNPIPGDSTKITGDNLYTSTGNLGSGETEHCASDYREDTKDEYCRSSTCLLQTDWDAGHFGAAGEDGYFSGHANENAFFLKSLDLFHTDVGGGNHDNVHDLF
ncbi:hypothetical protein SARC_05250 [Sphaeroforma arctica JP610]|uniref:Prolyl endopeptidase-like n=1 Tax=Sphaeroforma arctica JP610 TaxID=667725 RepID=A0A0L0G2M9_9EUKA|nr:hypothetical protein SARC_05250 [Sphaeroforma arctica JP610]KNC82458.1 hypothetical protein SARC_05250 [Sphaeroforma arctica JP610]|eukprot:XP_014156360.1 hypothetical protein SARC_05250 [Sphaeroforma arctica JP610]